MDSTVKDLKKKDNLDLLELIVAGCNSFELSKDNTRSLVQTNSYLIESLARAIEETTCEGDVTQDQGMSVFSIAQLIKFLAGFNAHLTDSAVHDQLTQ